MSFADGVLIVDKPVGPTSHDVVAFARRVTRASKVGHTGTLDPLASGVLPLVLGRATRLAQFLSSAQKEYDAVVQLGMSTTTFDRAGAPVERADRRSVSDLSRDDIEAAVDHLRGRYLQQPPAFSAKKVGGDRAYDRARQNAPLTLQPVEVTAYALDITGWRGTWLALRLVCSAGFYVRSLAQAIGDTLGTGAHLAELRRTRSGDFRLSSAVSLEDLEKRPELMAERVIPLPELLPWLPAVILTAQGASLAARGNFLSDDHLSGAQTVPEPGKVRLLHPDGHLVAIAESRQDGPAGVDGLSRLLHPGIVLE